MARRSQRDKREELGRIIQNEISRAENASDKNDAQRRLAVAYYMCRPRGDEVKDRSATISADVRNMTNAVMAQLVPMLSTDSVVNFEALGAEDEGQAKAESDALNGLVMEDNQGFLRIQEAVKDALLLRNGAMKFWIEDEIDQDEVDVSELETDEERSAAAVAELERNPGAEIELSEDGIVTVTRRNRVFRVAAVPIENLMWSAGSGPLQQRRFFAEQLYFTRSELVERGIPRKVVEDLPPADGVERLERDGQANDLQGETVDQEVIDCAECYLLRDSDGDGISERWRVLVAQENIVLEEERVSQIPYALGTPYINPHRLTGESLFDHVKDIQDGKTFFLRQYEDNVAAMVNGKYAYNPAETNEQDILNPVPGAGVRSRNPANVIPIPIPDVTNGSMGMLGYYDQRRTEAGGASLDMQQAQAQIAGDTAFGIERQYASKELIVSMMAANLGETLLRDLYTGLHRFVRTYATGPMRVKVSGQIVEVDPRTWPRRSRLNVVIGKTPGQRSHIQQTLAQHLGMQAQAMAAGMDGVLADASTIHTTSRALLIQAGIDNPDAMLIDPTSPAAQQAAKDKADAAAQERQQQLQLVQMQLELENRKLEVEREKNRGELAYKYFDTETQMAMKEAELVTGAEVDLEKQAREAAATARREAFASLQGPADGGNRGAA